MAIPESKNEVRKSIDRSLIDLYNRSSIKEKSIPQEVDFLSNEFVTGFKKNSNIQQTLHTGKQSSFVLNLNDKQRYFPSGTAK